MAAASTYADRSAYLPAAPLLLFPRRLSSFRYGAAFVRILSLSREDCCCILRPNEQQCAPAAAVRWSVSGLSAHRSARHQVEWTLLVGGDAPRRAPCAAANLRCKRLLGRAGTPCGHFSPRRCSSHFTLFRSHKPYGASHPSLCAIACARRRCTLSPTAVWTITKCKDRGSWGAAGGH